MEKHSRLLCKAFEIVADKGTSLQEIQKLAMGRTDVVFEKVSWRKQAVSEFTKCSTGVFYPLFLQKIFLLIRFLSLYLHLVFDTCLIICIFWWEYVHEYNMCVGFLFLFPSRSVWYITIFVDIIALKNFFFLRYLNERCQI